MYFCTFFGVRLVKLLNNNYIQNENYVQMNEVEQWDGYTLRQFKSTRRCSV